jgi:hypothetical protein
MNAEISARAEMSAALGKALGLAEIAKKYKKENHFPSWSVVYRYFVSPTR